MIIVGEKINTSLKNITEAVLNKDSESIRSLAVEQSEQGADYIDINCGSLIEKEVELLPWLAETVQSVVDKPCCIDSPNPKALEAALKVHKGKAMVNSITGEKDRYGAVAELVKTYSSAVVCLLMDDEHGMPEDVKTAVGIAGNLITRLQEEGVPQEDIYVDPLIQPISSSPGKALMVLDTIREIRALFPSVSFMCGLSNISYGLPKRSLINNAFLAMCMAAGLNGAILDPGDRKMMANIKASEALLARDNYMQNYLKAYRNGLL